jgi:hypothetical protein
MTHCAQSRSEIVESGSPLGSLEFQAFYRPRIFSLKLAREFFNRIDREQPVANGSPAVCVQGSGKAAHDPSAT